MRMDEFDKDVEEGEEEKPLKDGVEEEDEDEEEENKDDEIEPSVDGVED